MRSMPSRWEDLSPEEQIVLQLVTEDACDLWELLGMRAQLVEGRVVDEAARQAEQPAMAAAVQQLARVGLLTVQARTQPQPMPVKTSELAAVLADRDNWAPGHPNRLEAVATDVGHDVYDRYHA